MRNAVKCHYHPDKIKSNISKATRRILALARNVISRPRTSCISNPTSNRAKLRSFRRRFLRRVIVLDFPGGGEGWMGNRTRVTGLIVVPSLITALDGHGYCLTICHPHSTFIALPCAFITSAQSDLAAGNYECRYHSPCSIRPFIPFAAQCKSSRGAAWNMHRSPLIIMQPDNARVRMPARAFPFLSYEK